MAERLTPPRLTLDEPADHWADGHILGNGDVGAVVWGTPEAVRVALFRIRATLKECITKNLVVEDKS